MSPLDIGAWEKEVWRLRASTSLLGADCLANKPDTVVWVEDEKEILVCRTPDTANGQLEPPAPFAVAFRPPEQKLHMFGRDDVNTDPFIALQEHAADLAAVKRHVLAFQSDAHGNAMATELARRLGRHKCYLLKFPPHASTCQDIVSYYGVTDLAYAVKEADPYPINGIQLIKPGETIKTWLSRPPITLSSTGTGASDKVVSFPTDGRLIVVTGIPTMGKTSWVIFVMVHQMKKHDRRFVVFSPEMAPWQNFVLHCIVVLLRKPIEAATPDEIERAEKWLSTRLINVTDDSTDESPTLDWFLECAEASILRYGVTDACIDPWNAIEHSRGRMDRDEYVSASLFKCKAWAQRFSCNMWIVAHPTKMQPPRPGGEMPEPTMYDIKGGSEWYDRADLGFCVHRRNGLTQLKLLKAKFREYGKSGAKCEMGFDEDTYCYSTPPGDPGT
jgi:twinkle protein